MDGYGLTLFLFSLGAFFMPVISRKTGIPVLAAEIIFGIILRFFFSGNGNETEMIRFLSDMGFLFIMFLAGLEINFDNLKLKSLRTPFLIVLSVYGSVFVINYFSHYTFLYLIIFSSMSVGVVFLALKSHADQSSRYGQNMIWTATIGEIITVIFLIFIEVTKPHEHEIFSPVTLKKLAGLFALIIGAWFLMRLILFFLWKYPQSAYAIDSEGDTSELAVRLSFLLLMTMVAVSESFALDKILGAFLGGMILSFVFRNKTKVEKKLSSIGYGFFVPFFFIKTGWDLDIGINKLPYLLKDSFLLYALILITRIPTGFILAFDLKSDLFKYFKSSIGGIFLLAAPLTIIVAIGKIGLELKILDLHMYGSLIICSLIGGISGPVIYRIFRVNRNEFQNNKNNKMEESD